MCAEQTPANSGEQVSSAADHRKQRVLLLFFKWEPRALWGHQRLVIICHPPDAFAPFPRVGIWVCSSELRITRR